MDYAAGGAPACRRTLQGEGRPVLEEVKEAAAEGLKLPKDAALGEMLLSFVGAGALLWRITGGSCSMMRRQ